MAFDAGAIEATLTLNRSPFTAGLLAAKRQAKELEAKKLTLTVTAKLDRTSLQTIKEQINKAVARINVKVSLDRNSLKAVQAQINRAVGRIQVRVSLDRETLARVREQIARTVGRIQVRVTLDRESLAALRTRLATLNARVTVRPVIDRDALLLLRARLEAMNFRVNVRANIDRQFIQSFRSASQGFAEGSENLGRFQKILVGVIALLPVMASALTAAVGAVGALGSALLIAGLGAGAFALVAVPAFKDIKAAVASGQEAIDKLPSGLRQAGNALQAFNKELGELKKNTQVVTGIALANWFNAGRIALGTLQPLVVASALAFSNAANMAANFFGSPWWKQFVDFLSRAIGPAVDKLFRGLFALIRIVGNLTQAFWDLGGSQIMEMITKGLEDFAKWTDHIGQNKTFQDFMEAAKRSLPVVGQLLGDLFVFILRLAVALEPLGTLIIRVLDGIFDAVNKIPPSVLGALALGFAAIWAAMALGATGPVGIAVGVLLGLGAIFTDLYTKNEAFKTSLDGLVDFLKAKWQPIWDTIVANFTTYILPAWEHLRTTVEDRLMPALQRFGAVFMEEVWPKIEPFVNEVTGTLIPSVLRFLDTMIRIISWLVDVFGPTVAKEMGNTIQAFTGAFDIIAGALDVFTGVFTADWTTFTQGTTEITRGFWTIIAAMFGESFDDLRSQVQAWDVWLDSTWTNFWNGVLGFLRGIWDTIGLVFRASLDLMHGDVSAAADKIGQVWRKVANLFATPINWVINNVIGPPGGLAGAWNSVMSWIGAPGLNVQRPQNIPGFRDGGPVRGPGNGTSDDIIAKVSNGEYVIPQRIAKKTMPFLEALRAGQPEAMQATGAFLGRNIDIPAFAGGGLVEAMNFARAQGGPYVWGGVGPGGYDCSGFQSAIANVALGQFPYRRRFATASFAGGRGAGGFVPGLNSAYGIGVFQGNPGHMAGTIGGMNAESSGGRGAHTGPSARGATNGMFTQRFSLPQVAGAFIDGGAGGGAAAPVSWWSIVSDKVTSLFKGLFGGDIPGTGGVIGDALNNIPRLLVDKVIAALKDKLEKLMTAAGTAIGVTAQGAADNPLSGMGTSDRGAIIPPGASTLFNATGRPEPLTNLDVYERMKPAGLTVEDVLSLIKAGGGDGGTGGGDTYNVMLPERATVRELADTIDFKRKVVAKGRYVR
jgi:hypothetical protein